VEGFKTGTTDLAAARNRVQGHLTATFGEDAELLRLVPLAAGACQENFRLDVIVPSMPGVDRLVLRSDAGSSLPGSLGRKEEFAVVRTAFDAGVPTANAYGLTKGLLREDGHAYFLDWVEGVSLGAKLVKDPELEAARAALPDQLARAASKIHAISPDHAELSLPDADPDPVTWAVEFQREILDGLPEPHPGLELAWRWLAENQPDVGEVTLVHGDFRTGNFMVRPDGLAGILDWEFAHWGCPEEDLAWITVRDWRFGRLDRPVGGFARRADLFDAYETHSGRRLDPAVLHYWEVFGNVRWAAGAVVQGQRYLAGDLDLELVAIARRTTEMEYEALRLIEVGPTDWRKE
jgi:aminoglycoside phosphotransferase (APT) family kinase protein